MKIYEFTVMTFNKIKGTCYGEEGEIKEGSRAAVEYISHSGATETKSMIVTEVIDKTLVE